MSSISCPSREDAIRRFWRPLKHNLILGLLALLDRLMRLLPLGAARALGSGLGRFFYACVPYERRKTLNTLQRAYPDSDLSWRQDTAEAVFSHLGRSAAEFFRLSAPGTAGPDPWVAEVEGFEHLERPIREGRGVVAVTAHFGHWELLAAWVAQRLPTAVVARQAYDPRLDAVLTARREQNKITVFGRNTSVRPILRWLNEGKVLGVLADQDTGVDSLYVEFFGLPAKTPSGPAVLAQATGSDVVCGFCFRRPDGRYRLVFSPAIPVPKRAGGGPLELWGVVQEYTRRTEAAIREAPGLWAWNHARWRSDSAKASTGWDPRLAAGCMERIVARRAGTG